MISNKHSMTAQTPSRFGMPIYGSAFCATDVRERTVAGVQSLAMGTFPGTSAWRPPTC
jgi:hypothetical protein